MIVSLIKSKLFALFHKNIDNDHIDAIGSNEAPLRLLVIANAKIPTVQLSIVEPLKRMIDRRECQIIFLTEQQLKMRFGRLLGDKEAERWIINYCDQGNPTHYIFCRYSGPHAQVMLQNANSKKIPTIYNIDDDLLNVPIQLGQKKFDYHNDPKRLEAVRYLLDNTDLVYCSNKRLKDRLVDLGITGNLCAKEIYCAGMVIAKPKDKEVTKIGYMGFDHQHDFDIMLPALVKIMHKYPSLTFDLFGKIKKVKALDQFGNRVKVFDVVKDYDAFLLKLRELEWDVGICPLADTDFNKVKNVNKWVEYTSVGTAVIASKNRIYDDCCSDGCGVLVDDDEWFTKLDYLISNPTAVNSMANKAQNKLLENYSYGQLEQQLLSILKDSSEKIGGVGK